ncbi:MAG: caspase family protein [Sphingobacteriaceae bacterium]|nr:caspase family protein [Sphingobacteriaceae bacterium]
MSRYAIVIGINDYTPTERLGLKTLSGAIKDAERMSEWLITLGGVPAENCHLITSTADPLNPIKDIVDTAINNIVIKVAENAMDADRLYFYFAGHGLGVDFDLENTGLCMANWSDYFGDAASLSSQAYKRKFLSEGLFKEVVIWMDCCRTVKVSLNPAGPPRIFLRGPNNQPKWYMAYGTQYQKQAFEAALMPEEMRGIFTKVLLDGLNGAAKHDEGGITSANLSDYLELNVPLEAQNAGFSQYPEISSNLTSAKPMLFV